MIYVQGHTASKLYYKIIQRDFIRLHDIEGVEKKDLNI